MKAKNRPIRTYNGKDIHESGSGYSEEGFTTADYADPVSGWVYAPKGSSKMYYRREPRFYVNVAFCGAYCMYNNQADKYRCRHDYHCVGACLWCFLSPCVDRYAALELGDADDLGECTSNDVLADVGTS